MYEWSVPGRKNHSASWYTVASILVVSLAIWGVFTQMYALTFVVIVMAWVYIMLENNAPDSVRAVVNSNGIGVWEGFYDYGQISSFEVVFEDRLPRFLRIHLKKNSLRTLDVPISDFENPEDAVANIRAYLLSYIPEGEGTEITFFDKLIDKLWL